MSYIGRGNDAISNVDKLDNITFSGATTYNLTKDSSAFTPSGANNILISIDGVVQQNNFSVANATIVFDWSPTSNNTCDWILHYGVGVVNTPADGTVTTAKVADGAITAAKIADGTVVASEIASNAITTAKINADAVTGAKIADDSIDSEHYVDGSIDTAHIGATQVTGAKLNTDVISAQTALAVAPADTDEFMVSDGGVLKRIDYSLIKGGITEYDQWRTTSAAGFTGSGRHYVTANWERDDNGEFDKIGTGISESSGVFSFPSTGKWLINWMQRFTNREGGTNRALTYCFPEINVTGNNSSYGVRAAGACHFTNAGGEYYGGSIVQFLFDVDDTSNDKVKFGMYIANGVEVKGDTNTQHTSATFMKLGDT